MMIEPIRRVVTSHNVKGKSVILSDGPSPHVLTSSRPERNSVSPSNTPGEESK
jgi:hypothetical protein